ncbi:MAG: type II toxin-antitoxin system PemK/MazF family toxin [Solirubrobacteraceae bacterium]
MTRPTAGQIVVVDWRGGRQPDEPGGLRPAVVVEDDGLFAGVAYRNLLVVPMTTDARFAELAGLVERIDPTLENGAERTCWAIAHHVGSVALTRVRSTQSRISNAQLRGVRAKIALAVGVEPGSGRADAA